MTSLDRTSSLLLALLFCSWISPCLSWNSIAGDKLQNQRLPRREVRRFVVNDDSEAKSSFGTKEYWDELYLGRGDFPADEYQWYFGFEQYGKYVTQHFSKKASLLIPGIGNDPILLDLLQKGYTKLTATDYSEPAMDRQQDLLSYGNYDLENVVVTVMDARKMPQDWGESFDGIIEKGALDAIFLSGDGNFELAAKEFERVLKPSGILISVSGVVPMEKRRAAFENWEWIRDGSEDLQAGCFVLKRPSNLTEAV
mmetsp:Transcript_11999/g.19271  ORF Transcript_11999/g.19271 Transcript_11999/m.19271 type:complete len:254 (+) Transcript_11999:65-826(+)